MRYDPAYTPTAIASRVPLRHARVVLDSAREILGRVVAEQPRDRAWHPGPLDSPTVIAAQDLVETWTSVVALHERRIRMAPPPRPVILEAIVEEGTIAIEFTGEPLSAPCMVRDQYGDEHDVTGIAWQSPVEGGVSFAAVTVAGLEMTS